MATNEITKEELSFFLSGGIGLANTVKNPTNWLLDKSWDEMCRADDTLPPFRGFLDDFRANVTAWKKFYDLMNPQDAPIPQPWEQKLTAFQKLIVMRMIRPDKVTAKVYIFTSCCIAASQRGKRPELVLHDLLILIPGNAIRRWGYGN